MAENTYKPACPWCGCDTQPVSNLEDPDPVHARRNPLVCPECGGYGDRDDWGYSYAHRSAYEKGENVAVRSMVWDIHPDAEHVMVRTWGYNSNAVPGNANIAPWLSVEDQDALLRVVKAAYLIVQSCGYCGGSYYLEAGDGVTFDCYCVQQDPVVAAVRALPPHLVARLSEGE